MPGQSPRVVWIASPPEGGHDVFEVVSLDGNVLRVRSPFLFEIGEELALRIEDGAAREVTARVRSHTGDPRVTELELLP